MAQSDVVKRERSHQDRWQPRRSVSGLRTGAEDDGRVPGDSMEEIEG